MTALDELERLRDAHIISDTDESARAFADAAVNALPGLLDRVERLEKLVRDMIENEPDDLVSDGGHTVLDLWRHDARAALAKDATT